MSNDLLDTILFKKVFESHDAMMMFVDETTGEILRANAAAARFFELDNEDLAGKNIFDFNMLSREEAYARFLESQKNHRSYHAAPHRMPSGEIKIIESFNSRMIIGDRKVILSIIHDITEHQRDQDALRESERRFREMANDLPLGIFECDLKGCIFFANATAHSWFGYNREEVGAGALNILATVIPEDRARAAENTRVIMSGVPTPPHEYRAIKRDGSIFSVLIQSRPIYTGKVPSGMRGTIVDISEQRRLESALQSAEKLESLGVLAGGIAHDFNNLLTGIFGFIDVARLLIGRPAEARDALNNAVAVFARAKALTMQLLTFSKGGVPEKTRVDIAQIAKDATNFALSGSNISVSFDIPGGLWHCDADAHQLTQVIDNLVINARQAMPLGGNITITLRNISRNEAIPVPLPPADYLFLEIQDNGIGIPLKILPRIFEPFFTTKQQGSGLGLATAYSIINKHGGLITADSRPSGGATFRIYLPAAQAAIVIPAHKKLPPSVIGPWKVLVLDDEEPIRSLCRICLATFGCTVDTAADAPTAEEKYAEARAAGTPYDLLILDLTIPGGPGGHHVLTKLMLSTPDIRAIATSGYSEDPVMAEPAKFGFSARLTKPYLTEDLIAAVAAAMA